MITSHSPVNSNGSAKIGKSAYCTVLISNPATISIPSLPLTMSLMTWPIRPQQPESAIFNIFFIAPLDLAAGVFQLALDVRDVLLARLNQRQTQTADLPAEQLHSLL